MRIKPLYAFIIIVLLTAVSTWLTLPKDVLNIGGSKNGVVVHKGLDLQGGLQVVMEARPAPGQKVDKDVINGTRDTIQRRVNGLGVSEPLIQTRGSNQIVVELPGVSDPEAAVSVLQQTALLEIIDPQGQYLPVGTKVNTTLGTADSVNGAAGTPTAGTPTGGTPTSGTPSASPAASPEASPAAGAMTPTTPAVTGPTYTTIVTGADIKDAYPATDNLGQLVVGFEMKDSGASKLEQFTSQNLQRPMSIVVDKTVINTATVQAAISNKGQISGVPAKDVSRLAIQIKSGSLAVPLEVVQSRTVGPTLGQDSINKSIEAGLVGLTLVALMMILYYRLPGLLSVIALLIYSSITFALFKLIPVTLTLAGIAGFILSIGMAVDANVLIFSRLKDELRLGRAIPASIELGFDHAWPSIRDSNISTMLTCVILYNFGRYVGASIIQGFALTLFIGVIVSMFTAIVVTRTFMRVWLTVTPIRNRWWLGVEATHPVTGQAR